MKIEMTVRDSNGKTVWFFLDGDTVKISHSEESGFGYQTLQLPLTSWRILRSVDPAWIGKEKE